MANPSIINTNLQFLISAQDKSGATSVLNDKLGISLQDWLRMMIKYVAKTGQLPSVNLADLNHDETSWLLNNPAYGSRLLDSVNRLKNNKTQNLTTFKSVSELKQYE
jgi:antitoxin component of RelBE/YafQ-DinJ toxin-antitoxin module